MQEKDFSSGFNAGYIIRKFEYTLSQKLIAAKGEADYLKGFVLGCKQYDKEQFRSKVMSQGDRER